MIELQGVGKTYRPLLGRPVRAVDGVSITVRAGEVLGVAGPNGAGKSTLIGLLLGYLAPTDGTVAIEGEAPRGWVERNGVGYLSELVAIPPQWTAGAALRRYATLAGIPAAAVEAEVRRVADEFGVAEQLGKRMRTLSKGNAQRVGLAQAMLGDFRVMVLDEPTHGLDPVWTARFRDTVAALRRPDRAILVASHNLDELQRVADRVAIVDRGVLQRVVETRAGAGDGAAVYHLAFASGAELAEHVFPGAVRAVAGAVEVHVSDLAALNRGLSELLSRGAVLSAVTPAHSELEREFRRAVGEGAAAGGGSGGDVG